MRRINAGNCAPVTLAQSLKDRRFQFCRLFKGLVFRVSFLHTSRGRHAAGVIVPFAQVTAGCCVVTEFGLAVCFQDVPFRTHVPAEIGYSPLPTPNGRANAGPA